MNRRYSTIMTVAAVAVMAGALFGSNYSISQLSAAGVDANVDALDVVRSMGGLQMVMPEAYATAGPCDEL